MVSIRQGKSIPWILVDEQSIVYVPYYFRANSGGKGHMRVGLVKGC